MPVGSIISGLIGRGGALAAGGAAAEGGRQSLENAKDWAKTLYAWASPYIEPGNAASNELTQLYGLGHLKQSGDTYGDWRVDQNNREADAANALGRFRTSPGYQFRLQEGINALDRSAAAKGMLFSGAQAKGISDYGQNTASDEFGNYTNALRGLQGQGAQSLSAASGQGASVVGQGINAFNQGEMARASSYSNAANALANGIMSGVNSGMSLGALGYGMGWFDKAPYTGGGGMGPGAFSGSGVAGGFRGV
jgi:hypothetical protein